MNTYYYDFSNDAAARSADVLLKAAGWKAVLTEKRGPYATVRIDDVDDLHATLLETHVREIDPGARESRFD